MPTCTFRMNSSSERDDALFAEALTLPEGERRAFLDRACIGDPDSCRRIEELLRAHQAAGDFMRTPAVVEAGQVEGGSNPGPWLLATTTGRLAPGERIGRYKLLERIGEGGFGVVYLAEQEEPVRRRVALKVI